MGTMGYIELTKLVCQLGKSSLQTGILPGLRLLSTSLKSCKNQLLLLSFVQTSATINSLQELFTHQSSLNRLPNFQIINVQVAPLTPIGTCELTAHSSPPPPSLEVNSQVPADYASFCVMCPFIFINRPISIY